MTMVPLSSSSQKKKNKGGERSLPSSSHFNSVCFCVLATTMLKLLTMSSTPKVPSSSCFHAPSATTLKLLMMCNTPRAPSSSCFHAPTTTTLKLLTTIITHKALAMEVSTKGGVWGGGQHDELGRWVGRKKGVGGLGFRVQVWRVGRSFPKKNLGSWVGQKKLDNKTVAKKKEKKTELGKKRSRRKKNLLTK